VRHDHFEWDDRKAAANLAKHEVSFDLARLAFDDPFAEERLDETTDEPRTVTTGMAGGVLLVVVSTEREGRTRVIPARRATPHERKRFEG
jgi:uncharacterized protein